MNEMLGLRMHPHDIKLALETTLLASSDQH
jgi:hypothetical protein